ncbi:hypothetical protein NQ314_014303 [Rhamnusium bicolor]|uniref:Uncharacterized protein n=1 Tax=Rhamnusium bicolor TaxID=1586634 RepID=A0AAV8X2Y0_9CUCU|nr:hypothetical protein NQ314_014303 [Rhamnusium bicolor]
MNLLDVSKYCHVIPTSTRLLFLLLLKRNVLRLCGLILCNLDLFGYISPELSSTGLPGLRGVVEVSPM